MVRPGHPPQRGPGHSPARGPGQVPVSRPGLPVGHAPTRRQRLAGAGLSRNRSLALQLTAGCVGAQVLGFLCGLVGADYVESAYFGLIVPALSGLVCGWIISRAAPHVGQRYLTPIAMVYGAASAGCAFVYASTPYGAVGTWLPPVLCGVAGAVAWPYVDPAPPGR